MEMELTKVSKKELLDKCNKLTEQLAEYKEEISALSAYRDAIFKICDLFGLNEPLVDGYDVSEDVLEPLMDKLKGTYAGLHNYLILNAGDGKAHDAAVPQLVEDVLQIADTRKDNYNYMNAQMKAIYLLFSDEPARHDNGVFLVNEVKALLTHKAAELKNIKSVNTENNSEYQKKVNETAVQCAKALLALVNNENAEDDK